MDSPQQPADTGVLAKLLRSLQRQGGPLVPMSSGGVPMANPEAAPSQRMPPAQMPGTTRDSPATVAYMDYPKLKEYGLKYMDSRGSGESFPHGGGSETYPANELYNPLGQGSPVIEQRGRMGASGFLGEALHIAPSVDPKVAALKAQFLQSMTPEQNAQMKNQYEYARKNFGENRPFEQWKQVSGDDSWFRGYITKQWPSEAYTPAQIQLFGELSKHLQGR